MKSHYDSTSAHPDVCCLHGTATTVRSFPITLQMSRALAGLALSWDWFLEAAAILVGFDGMLRVMELLKIQARHVSGNLQGASSYGVGGRIWVVFENRYNTSTAPQSAT